MSSTRLEVVEIPLSHPSPYDSEFADNPTERRLHRDVCDNGGSRVERPAFVPDIFQRYLPKSWKYPTPQEPLICLTVLTQRYGAPNSSSSEAPVSGRSSDCELRVAYRSLLFSAGHFLSLFQDKP